MTLEKTIQEIKYIILDFLKSSNNLDIKNKYNVTEPPDDKLGDLTTNIAFLLSKKINEKPYEIAQNIVKNFIQPYLEKNRHKSLIWSVEAHKSGHINFKINYSNLGKYLIEIIKKKKIDIKDIGKGQKIIIEHTSVNPNKALHIGHLRNIVLGDTLYRLFKKTNYKPKILNYIDDSGVQVADIVLAFKYGGFDEDSTEHKKYDHYCGDIYIEINKEFEKNPKIIEKRKEIIKEIENGDSEISEYTRKIVNKVVREQLNTCWRIKARYDILNIESQIIASKLWSSVFNLLKENKIVTLVEEGKNKGCWIVKIEDEEDKVVVRSDGTATYIAKDIPYAMWKLGLVEDPFTYEEFEKQWDNSILLITKIKDEIDNKVENSSLVNNDNNKVEKIITIIDSRQARLQKIISNILNALKDEKRYHYLRYESVALSSDTVKNLGFNENEIQSEVVQMSGRKGIFINADDILEELKKKINDEMLKRNPNTTEKERDIISEGIAISTIRYSLIKQDLDKLIIFDVKEAISLNGDTSLYLQYSYARAQRILEKIDLEKQENKNDENVTLLQHKKEIDLIKEISKINMIITESVKNFSPKLIARYGYQLATKFNLFYETLSVLNEKNKKLRDARIILIKAFTVTMSTIFDLIGIQILDRI